jgi:hypothetical protein
MKRWECRIEVIRETVLEAEDAGRARVAALDWFFNECVHAIGDDDVQVEPISEGG